MRAGPYQLLRLLGRGGNGEVWEAKHVSTGKRVAVKRLLEVDAKRAASVVDEARLLSALHHPNIVALEESDVTGEAPWLAVELVEGESAAALLAREQRLDEPAAAYVALCVARALEAAHQAGFVHRDVTPSNVLLARDGAVKLSDFGIAWARERVQQTTVGTVKGTPSFMAPEQSTGGSVDARADVFSLGCVLHALVTGESPLAGENRLVDLLAGAALPLSPSLSAPLRAVLAKALARDRMARFASAADFATQLEALAGPREALAARVPSPAVEAPATSRWPWLAVPLAAATLCGAVWLAFSTEPPRPVEVERAATLEPVVLPLPVAHVTAVDAGAPAVKVVHVKAPPTATGVLAVGGEAAVRGEVLIDGKPFGYAPRLIELPVGAHQLEVVLQSGERWGPRTVQLRETDTQSAPQRVVISPAER